jgi:PKD repeat protein
MKKRFTQSIPAFVFFSLLAIFNDLAAQNVYIPDPAFKNALVSDVGINTNFDTEIQVSEASAVTGTLYMGEYGISDLTGIEAFVNITGLDCGTNNLSNIDISNNTQLTSFTCSGNYLTSLDVSNNPNLYLISFGYNFISTIDLSANTALTDIYGEYGQLTSITLPPGNVLTNIYLPGNQLTSIDVSANPNLAYIYVSGNNLTCLDLTSNPNLINVVCDDNDLTGLNLLNGNNTSISFFNSYNNPNLYCIQVEDVAFSGSNWPNHDPGASYSTNCGTPTADFNATDPVCFGTPVVFVNLSWNYDYSLWDFGDGNTSTANTATHTYDSTGNYVATLIASNCYGSDTISYSIMQGSDVHGHVSYSGGDVTNGVAIIYTYEPYYISFDTIEIANIDAGGNFHFTNIPQGDYLIKVFADTIIYPDLIPTYSYSDWAWDSALVVLHGCVYNDTTNVYMLELPPPSTGSGLLHGIVIEGPGFGRAQGDPIHGVDVKLGVTGSSSIIANTTTDTNGEYSFGNLPFGSYTIYADIPGLERDSSYQIILDAVNDQYLSLDYEVDSNSVYIVEGIGIENYYAPENSNMVIYPNPVKDHTNIFYTINEDAKVKLEIYNVYGVMMQSLVNTALTPGEYNLTYNPKSNNLKPGVYFITLTVDGKSRSLRIVVME